MRIIRSPYVAKRNTGFRHDVIITSIDMIVLYEALAWGFPYYTKLHTGYVLPKLIHATKLDHP
jgi:hypothetical protein